jgi:nicotinamidase-related amidase
MQKKNALLIIDPQNDFCNPGDANGNGLGSLFVPNADKDMETLAQWVSDNKSKIDGISVTLDSHQVNDIAHPSFWCDKDGNQVPPFTPISAQDVKDGTWIPSFAPKRALEYLEALESNGQFGHFVWPEHCLIGTEGHAVYKPLAESLKDWSRDHWQVQYITKGTNPYTEHFGAFQAQIPDAKDPSSQFNQRVTDYLESYQNIYFAGEASSHCVATTLKQLMDEAPGLAQKLIILEDAMSPVPNFEDAANDIYQQARDMGIRFSTTAAENLVGSVATAI